MNSVKNICCIGAGYVGGPTMAVIALKCPEIKVTVVDIDQKKIEAWNSQDLSQLPVYEPGLQEVIQKVRGKNLFFSNDIDHAILESEMIFMAVNTPTKTSGEGKGMAADLTYVEQCAKRIGKVAQSDKIVIEKSTLPVRTAEKIKDVFKQQNQTVHFEVLSNPEFLAEGTAIEDLFYSDRVLIGGDPTTKGQQAIRQLVNIYQRWIPKEKILTSNIWSAELSKLASNAMLAQRISSINALSALCEKTGANIHEVAEAIGMDQRIGPMFLKCSVAFGGSCFKKDVLNLVYMCQTLGLNQVADYWESIIHINHYQTHRFTDLIIEHLEKDTSVKRSEQSVCLLGWAFKKNTNDSRESPAIKIGYKLLELGFLLSVYDPMVASKRIQADLLSYHRELERASSTMDQRMKMLTIHSSVHDAIKGTSAIAIITEWDEFKDLDWNRIINGSKNELKIFDGRDIVDSKSISDTRKLYKIGVDL